MSRPSRGPAPTSASGTGRFEPTTPEAFARRWAATLTGATRIGVDGAVDADTAWLAGFVADAVEATGRPVARVSWRGFWRSRSLRLEHGRDDPDSYYDLWTDVAGLRREVLDTMRPGGPGTWLPSLWDAGRDRASRAARVQAAPGTVVVLDGPFLLRPQLGGALDAVVHLRTSDAAVRRRAPDGQAEQVLGAWHRYCAEVTPEAAADAVLRFEDPRHPALVRPA